MMLFFILHSRIMEPDLVMAKVQLPSEKSTVRVKNQPNARPACHVDAGYDDCEETSYAGIILRLHFTWPNIFLYHSKIIGI